MEELDKSFASLVNSQVLTSLTEPGKMNALKALVNKDISSEQVKGNSLPLPQKIESIKQVCFNCCSLSIIYCYYNIK